jgi:hypothetical protein
MAYDILQELPTGAACKITSKCEHDRNYPQNNDENEDFIGRTQRATSCRPHSHIENRIGRVTASSAFVIVV